MKKLLFGSAIATAVFACAGIAQADTVKNWANGTIINAAMWGSKASPVAVTNDNDYILYSFSTDTAGASNPSSYPDSNLPFAGHSLTLNATLLFSNLGSNVAQFPGEGGVTVSHGVTLRHWNTSASAHWSTLTGTVLNVVKTMYVKGTKQAGGVLHWNWWIPLVGDANTSVEVGARYHATYQGTTDLCLYGDCSQYLGKLAVKGNNSTCGFGAAFGGDVTVESTTAGAGHAALLAGDVSVKSMTFAAGDTTLRVVGSGVKSVRTLALVDGMTIVYESTGSGDDLVGGGYIKVSDSLTLASGSSVVLKVEKKAMELATWAACTNRVKLLEYAGADAASFVGAGKFTFEAQDTLSYKYYTFDPGAVTYYEDLDANGHFCVYAEVERPIVYQIMSDSSGGSHPGSALATGAGQYKWSDHRDQHAGAHYVVTNGMQLMVLSGTGSDRFVGDTLTVLSGASFTPCSDDPKTFYTTNLTLFAGALVKSYSTRPYVSITGCVVRLSGASSGYVDLRLMTDSGARDLYFANGICGNAGLRIIDYTDRTAALKTDHRCYLAAPSPDYYGFIEVTPRYVEQDQANSLSQAFLTIADAAALGGKTKQSTVQDRLAVYGNQGLEITGDTTFDDPLGRISFKTITHRNVPAKVLVAAGKTARINNSIKFYGRMRKLGAGTLAFGNRELAFVAEASRPEDDNVFFVEEGAFMPLTQEAVDGLAVVFTNNATLMLPYTSTYGLYNKTEKWHDKPLTVAAGSKITVRIVDPDDANWRPSVGVPYVVCTLPTGYEGVTESDFKAASVTGLKGEITSEETADGKQFKVTYQSAGLMLFMR